MPNDPVMAIPDRPLEFYARVERDRIPGETFLAAAQRIIVEDVVKAMNGSQLAASKFLGVSEWKIGYELSKGYARRANLHIGQPELNQHKNKRPWSPQRRAAYNRMLAANPLLKTNEEAAS